MEARPFSIRVEPDIGSSSEDVFEHAHYLAKDLRVSSVDFDFNGIKCMAFRDGTGTGFDSNGIALKWSIDVGVTWVQKKSEPNP